MLSSKAIFEKPAPGRERDLSMNNLRFLLAVHNHQPVGNFGFVFKRAFEDCYLPFLQEMVRHPAVKFTLHFSGPLWEYMQAKEKGCWELTKEMVGRGQVELLSGGFYEPILSIIPEEDRLGQIRMMNQFLEEHFRVKPRGLWLTERVWEPQLPKTLAQAGLKYTLLDEEHFHYAGIKNIYAPYITEEQGYPLVLFPVNKKLRYLIPFYKVEEIQPYFQEIAAENGVAILGDDGEKFGLWPGTHRWVYEEGWLRKFLDFLEREAVQTKTYSEYLDTRPRCGRAYLPPASYEEMMEWILEPGDFERFKALKKETPAEARRFLRGGYFREFFLKYSESNHLHKRMLLVSKEVNTHKNEAASKELYQGQCNDPYWHGVFGGLYLPHLREAAYRHLLEAEKTLPLRQGWATSDYDFDGREELFHRGGTFNLILKPSFGGSLVELDYRALSRNLSDVLSRREESYHRRKEQDSAEGKSIHELTKSLPPQAASLLRYDWHPRFSLLDHFLHPQTTQEDFRRIDFGEKGDFVNQEYEFELGNKKALLQRQGHIWVNGERAPLKVAKEIFPESGLVTIAYEIESLSEKEIPLLFGCEWNLYLLPREWEIRKSVLLLLGGRLSLEFSPPPLIWQFPLETLSQSEEGYDIIHQGMCFLPHWKFTLSGRKKFFLTINLREQNVQ
jgi:alpha-amylase/alpha-mannosidase (GH57 family)